MGTLQENQYTFLIVSRSIPLGVKHFSDKSVENSKQIVYVQPFFVSKIMPL